ncbi:MAG TPA: aldehyde dehydrogenase family protein [bacterium]
MARNDVTQAAVASDALAELGIAPENSGACIGGLRWMRAAGAELVPAENPATEEVLAGVYGAQEADYREIVHAAVDAFREWRAVPAPARGEVVRLIADELRAHKDALGTLISLESGKIKPEGDGEVQEMIDIADFAVGQARMLYGQAMHSERPRHRMYEQWHPLGPVGVITAFNFPVAVWAWNACIAAVCGDPVVWKPSPKGRLCAVAVQHLCDRVLERTGHRAVFNLLAATDTPLVERLVADRRLPLISFTGSSRAGHRVALAVAERLGRSLLECSGNNAVIVDESADLDLAVPAIVFGAVGTAGQRCTTTRRVLVHESIHDALIERLIHAYRQITVGDPLDPGVLMGPLIDSDAVDRFRHAVATIEAAGGAILFGGEALPGPGHYVMPTLARAENHWPIVQEETFAPILYCLRFRELDEAIAMNNAVPQGLSSALFTNDLRHGEQFLSATGSDCGIANLNIGTSGAEIGGAFGGEKETGGGREAGSDAWKAYMRRQTTTINWGRDLPLAQGIRFDLGGGATE